MDMFLLEVGGFLFDTGLWEWILGLALALVAWGLRWVAKQGWADKMEVQLAEALVLATQRIKDKIVEEVKVAISPGSDGGKAITAAEKSKIRQEVYTLLMNELKGPLLDYAKDKGEAMLKGKIGVILDNILGKIGVSTSFGGGGEGSGGSES